MKKVKLLVIAIALGGLAGCETVKQAQSKVSAGFSSTKQKVVKTSKSTRSKVSRQTALVTGGLVGEDEYEKAIKKARRRYKKMPSAQICWQAKQEIAQSWELFKANKRFIRKNSLGSTGNKLWKAFTSNLYKTVDNAVPLPLPDLPEDRIKYAAKQVEFNRKNIEEWSVIYDSICKK